jgi:hypothetical protein
MKRFRPWGAFALIMLAACSTSKVVLNDPEFSAYPSIDFEAVRFRRPATPVFDVEAPKLVEIRDAAGNLLIDGPKALGTLDCERSEDFFSKLNLSAIRSCLNRNTPAGKGAEVKAFELEWALRKDGQPSLELRYPEEAPECIRSTLAQIPFPQELVFVVPNENLDRGDCYTSRLNLDSGELLGWELPRARIRLRVGFPLRDVPRTDREVERMLRAWTLSIYRGGSRENGAFHGRFLPARYCLKCMGIPENPERGAPTVPPPITLWPSPAGGESVRW